MKKRYTVTIPASLRQPLMVLLLCCGFGSTVWAQPVPQRVLFIGNSFTGANNLPQIVKTFADHAGLLMDYEAFTPGGATVKYLPHGDRSHASNPMVYDIIRSRPWDYIVIQDNQGFFCLPTIGDYGMRNETEKGHMQIRDSLLKVNPCGKMILFSGWLDKDPYAWEPSLGLFTPQQANTRVYQQYKLLNDRFVQHIVSPIGIVWNQVLTGLPHLELFAADGYHPTYPGSYVAAAALFSTIFRQSAEEVPFDGGLSPTDARFIRKAAYTVVRDSLKPTGLVKFMPELLVAPDGMITVGGTYLEYIWYKDGLPIPGATGKHWLGEPGPFCYKVKVRDSRGCEYWSLPVCDIRITTGISGSEPISLNYYPNPVKDVLTIDHQDLRAVSLSDLSGRVLYSGPGDQLRVDMSSFGPGLYLLRVEDRQGRSGTQKIIKE